MMLREKRAGALGFAQAPRDEKNRRFVSWAFKGKGTKKLNVSFAPLQKL
jgi:hypothetical protein